MKNCNKPPLFSMVSFLSLACLIDVMAVYYVPTDKILLNCGGPPEATDNDGRKWESDIGSKFVPSSSKSSTSSAAQQPFIPEVPYMTARIFQSEFTYSFPVASGRKFIRLYFYPASYNGLDASNGIFSVTAGSYTLLRNFSAAQTTKDMNYDTMMKEFSVNVVSEVLSVTFTPSANISNSYAFVNGIEVVSHPDIYSTDGTVMVLGRSTGFNIDNSTALENVYRLNVGGNYISPTGDTGLFRSWKDDVTYIFGAGHGVTETNDPNVTFNYPSGMPSYIAPLDVYKNLRSMGPNASVNQNYNLTWDFTVDSGFFYLVRLHFCEVTDVITKLHQRVFKIFLNNHTAEKEADVIGWAGSNGVPIYKDYVVQVPSGSPQQILWLALHPSTESRPQYYDAILNGVEIFKVNNTRGNLAGISPSALLEPKGDDSSARASSGSGQSNDKAIIGGVGGGIAAVLFVGVFVCFVSISRKNKKDSSTSNGWLPLSLYRNSHSSGSVKTTTTGSIASSLHVNLCRHFSIAEIKAATKNFDEALLLGIGGFGKVYRGEIDGGTKVAIKRGNPLSDQGVHEFQTEIEMLSKLRHLHLVSLIGYCEENCEMILVYDYMAYGTLREHLYKTQNPPLSWKCRLEICIGAARGLHYLHTGAKHTIIHRDVKTTNILLDEKWVAKVSDFGLSKTGPSLDHTHVSTVVKGSFGYLDPEYFRRQQLTEKSDVYSFGVVLLEILCARPALNPTLPKEQVSLAELALHCHNNGILDRIMDPYLKGKVAPECFKKFAETAVKCLSEAGTERPSMGDVLWNLEFALQLQKSADESDKGIGEMNTEEDVTCKEKKDPDASSGFDGNITDSKSSGISMSIGNRSLASNDSNGLTPSAVFSQIMNPEGR
ncbi:receptor-like protein kinase FERONIA [Olea europaea var. sylvestris]|uniref:receptor-like protein kinase FERONIA n=1 Tax=Olea europaea var. sylvestris TaxID=158386 RepID=UPI000C1CEB5D|nr:receptor-like protein kinase FERONIA [Olea europaea var. sylvestris]